MKEIKTAIISNCIDEKHRQAFENNIGKSDINGIFKPLLTEYNNFFTIIFSLNITANELLTREGIERGRKYFISAVKEAEKSGAKIILLAASTKRLFGHGKELKSLFPELVFTIGDNGSALSFRKQIDYFLNKSDDNKPVLIIGAGFLGNDAHCFLKNKNKNSIFISKHKINGCSDIYPDINSFVAKEKKNVKIVLGCTHTYPITSAELDSLNGDGELYIVDVAVPKCVPSELVKNMNHIKRIDGGDYFVKDMKFIDFPAQLIGLHNEGDYYGCFMEATILGAEYDKMVNEIRQKDLFKVNDENIEFINSLLLKYRNKILIPIQNQGKGLIGEEEFVELS